MITDAVVGFVFDVMAWLISFIPAAPSDWVGSSAGWAASMGTFGGHLGFLGHAIDLHALQAGLGVLLTAWFASAGYRGLRHVRSWLP